MHYTVFEQNENNNDFSVWLVLSFLFREYAAHSSLLPPVVSLLICLLDVTVEFGEGSLGDTAG